MPKTGTRKLYYLLETALNDLSVGRDNPFVPSKIDTPTSLITAMALLWSIIAVSIGYLWS